jgi:predicted 3-demethylubiquinone-9 3-methyltransferase (glyoxalase superfamily)
MITVNSISFSNSLRPSQPATNRLVGNAGDVVTVSMIITTDNTLGDILFNFNCVPNNQQIYADSLTGGIFQSAFNSLTNNAQQLYFENGTLSIPVVPKSFDSTTSFVVTATGNPNEHSIVHTFRLAPFLRENELDNNNFTNPNYYSNTGLKYIFKIDSVIDNSLIDSTDDVNLETSNIIRNGNVSGWGSSLGTGAINYELSYTPNLIDINDSVTTIHTAQIKKNGGAWVVTDLISYRLQAISEISGYNFATSLLQNTKFDSVTHNIEDAPQDGANGYLLNCFCEINATDNTLLDVSFSIAANYSDQFSVFFACSSDSLAFEHQNTIAIFGTATEQGDNSQVEFVNYQGFQNDFKIGFINWFNQTFVDEGFNHLRAYRKDDNEVFFGVKINAPSLVLPPTLIPANLSNSASKALLTLNNSSFPFPIAIGNSIAVQYFRNSWFADIIVIESIFNVDGVDIGFVGSPVFSGFPLGNNIGNPDFGRLRNITTSSAVLEFGQAALQSSQPFPANSNFPNGASGGNGTFDSEPSLITLECGFKDLNTNQFLTNETFNFDFATTVPLQVDRGYIRKDDNPKKYIQVAFVGDRYEFRYGFNLGAEFLVSDNIVFEVNVTFTDSNGFALTNSIRSPRIEAGQYDVTQNTIAEPQVLASPIGQPKFYLVDGSNTPDFGTEYDGIKAGRNMLIVSTFQDNNLNDLQANEADLAGYFAITTPNEIKETERYFFSTYDSETDTPFEAVNGHTAGRVKVTKVDIKTATLSAIINYDRLKLAFPNQRNICIVSRLDRPQPTVFYYFKNISVHFTSSPSGQVLIANPATENWINQTFYFDGNHIAADFQFKINPTGAITKSDASWALYPYLSLASFESASILTGYTVRVECINLNSKTDVLGILEYSSLVPTATPFSGTHFRHKDSAITDFLAFYKEDVTIASLTVSNATRYYNVRNNSILNANSNLTNFLALNIVNLNTALALSAQKYGHFYNDITTLTDKTTTITGNFGSGNIEVIEYLNPAKYQYAPFLNNPPALRYDGINDSVIAPVTSLDWNTIANDSYIYIRACINNKGQSNRFLGFAVGANITITGGAIVTFQGGSVNISPANFKFGYLDGEVLYINLVLRKRGNSGTAAQLVYLAESFVVINSYERIGFQVNVNGTATPAASGGVTLGTINATGSLQSNAVNKLGWSILLTPPSLEDCHRFCRGETVPNMQYEWDFTALAGTQLTAIGTIAHPNANVLGGAGVGSLFN